MGLVDADQPHSNFCEGLLSYQRETRATLNRIRVINCGAWDRPLYDSSRKVLRQVALAENESPTGGCVFLINLVLHL
jgi:hypothetical protein